VKEILKLLNICQSYKQNRWLFYVLCLLCCTLVKNSDIAK